MELEIPSRLKEARKHLNLNQIQIAGDLNIQQKSISDLENGKIQNIPNTYIYYFYKKGVSLDWIYDGREPMMLDAIINSPSQTKDVPVDNLIQGTIEFPDNLEVAEKNQKTNDILSPEPDKLYERIIDSKEYNIKTLLAYIKSLENSAEYLKDLLNKTLVNKFLDSK